MKLGNNLLICLTSFFFFYNTYLNAEDKIISSPLINLEKIKPSFEDVETLNNDSSTNNIIKNKKKSLQDNNISSAKFIGLDKITAKTSEIIVKLGETKNLGLLKLKY